MKIGIEAQRIFRKNKHGMDYVVLQEILELQKMDTENEYFVFVKPGEDKCVESTSNVHVVEISCPSYPLWEQWALPRAAKKAKVEILHCTSNTAPIWCDIPLILTLHDIIYLEKREKGSSSIYQNLGWYYRRIVVPRIVRKCVRIITVSNFERNNIMIKLSIPQNRLKMIHNGYNDTYIPLEDKNNIYQKYIEQPNYFFILGNTDTRKNVERMLIAYSKYLQNSAQKRKLLLTGLSYDYVLQLLKRNHIGDTISNINLTGYVPTEDLPYLYNNAYAFLFASLREGFGIPIIEAMACGTPVITSNTSSMPEIGGPDAILINPESSDEIADMMLRLETDAAFYQKQKEIGLKRAKLFSWKKTATNLLQLYKEVYQELSK
ncbi:MAG: glycosyltransferase family 4 protein [Prevotella sp.]|nr:glycosyltransferase family 4 protein [Prevotella sp.]